MEPMLHPEVDWKKSNLIAVGSFATNVTSSFKGDSVIKRLLTKFKGKLALCTIGSLPVNILQ